MSETDMKTEDGLRYFSWLFEQESYGSHKLLLNDYSHLLLFGLDIPNEGRAFYTYTREGIDYYQPKYNDELYSKINNGGYSKVLEEYGVEVDDGYYGYKGLLYPINHKNIFFRPSFYRSTNTINATHGLTYYNSTIEWQQESNDFGKWKIFSVDNDSFSCTKIVNLTYPPFLNYKDEDNKYKFQRQYHHFTKIEREKPDGTTAEVLHSKGNKPYQVGYFGIKLYGWALGYTGTPSITSGGVPMLAGEGWFDKDYYIQPTDKVHWKNTLKIGVPQFKIKNGITEDFEVKKLNRFIDFRHGYKRINNLGSFIGINFLFKWAKYFLLSNCPSSSGENCFNIFNSNTIVGTYSSSTFTPIAIEGYNSKESATRFSLSQQVVTEPTVNPLNSWDSYFANIEPLIDFLKQKDYKEKLEIAKKANISTYGVSVENFDNIKRNAFQILSFLQDLVSLFLNSRKDGVRYYDKEVVINNGYALNVKEYQDMLNDYEKHYKWYSGEYTCGEFISVYHGGVKGDYYQDIKGQFYRFPMIQYFGYFNTTGTMNYYTQYRSRVYNWDTDENGDFLNDYWKYRPWDDLEDITINVGANQPIPFKIIRSFTFGDVELKNLPMVFNFKRRTYGSQDINLGTYENCLDVYKKGKSNIINPTQGQDLTGYTHYKRYFHSFRRDYGVVFSLSGEDHNDEIVESSITYINDNIELNNLTVWKKNEDDVGNVTYSIVSAPINPVSKVIPDEDNYGNQGIYLSLSLYNCDEQNPEYYNVNDYTYLGAKYYVNIKGRGIKSIYSKYSCEIIGIVGSSGNAITPTPIKTNEYIYQLNINEEQYDAILFKYAIDKDDYTSGAGFSNLSAPADYGTFRFSTNNCPSGYVDILINGEVDSGVVLQAKVETPQYPILYGTFSIETSGGIYITAQRPDSDEPQDKYGNGYKNEHYAKGALYDGVNWNKT